MIIRTVYIFEGEVVCSLWWEAKSELCEIRKNDVKCPFG